MRTSYADKLPETRPLLQTWTALKMAKSRSETSEMQLNFGLKPALTPALPSKEEQGWGEEADCFNRPLNAGNGI
jgi:hypothetical protein